ncbi:LuxR family transcriptional regulator [Algicella marina]|uniref:LuxR family transcriptional regulator n=1 Tax=Algicella marina TaxID=2683284 RepID=A0A6P1T6I2_9RHOB|nr:LuxR family transcriptional regulator [Algicella marina]QHQ36869.1 LuxR family transcriptional regulator [Algicella marina]
MGDLENFLKDVGAATWSEPLWTGLIEFCSQMGFPMVAYHHLPPMGATDEGRVRVVSHGYPGDWTEKYIRSKLFRIDPMPAVAFRQEMPVYWSEVINERGHGDKERAFLANLSQAGLGDGLAIPAFGPGGRNGYFGLGFGGARIETGRGTRTILQCACQAAHQRYCILMRESLPVPPALSQREIEILEWVARGKSNTVIADILGLSSHTVDAYLRRVFVKLGTTDRITAAIRGLGMGVIRGYVT